MSRLVGQVGLVVCVCVLCVDSLIGSAIHIAHYTEMTSAPLWMNIIKNERTMMDCVTPRDGNSNDPIRARTTAYFRDQTFSPSSAFQSHTAFALANRIPLATLVACQPQSPKGPLPKATATARTFHTIVESWRKSDIARDSSDSASDVGNDRNDGNGVAMTTRARSSQRFVVARVAHIKQDTDTTMHGATAVPARVLVKKERTQQMHSAASVPALVLVEKELTQPIQIKPEVKRELTPQIDLVSFNAVPTDQPCSQQTLSDVGVDAQRSQSSSVSHLEVDVKPKATSGNVLAIPNPNADVDGRPKSTIPSSPFGNVAVDVKITALAGQTLGNVSIPVASAKPVAKPGNVFADGHAFHPSGFSLDLVKQINALPKAEPTVISGNYKQIDLFAVCPVELKFAIMKELRKLQPQIPVHWVFHQLKVLIGDPGVLEQITHTDSMRRYLAAIIHLNAAPTTVSPDESKRQGEHEEEHAQQAMPLFSTEIGLHAHRPFNEVYPNWPFPFPKDAHEFRRYIVLLASVMFFLMDQPHRAPKNRSGVPRMALFCAMGPPFATEAERFDDGISIFEFEYARRVYGPFSKECLGSLGRYYATHNPLNHYQHEPKLTARWRALLDPAFAKWTTGRLLTLCPELSAQKPKRASKTSQQATESLRLALVVTAEDRAYARRALAEGLLPSDVHQARFGAIAI